MPTPRNFTAELQAARDAQDWESHTRIWEERRAAAVDADEARLRAPRVAILIHPCVGLLTFACDENGVADGCAHMMQCACAARDAAVYDTAADIGETFDINHVGTLKSRVTVLWDVPSHAGNAS